MKICGIIVEYNPFHNGHRYHAEMAREQTGADIVIAVMSGNFYSVVSLQLSTNGPEQLLPSKTEWIWSLNYR